MQILHLDSSVLGDASASRELTRHIVDALLQQHPAARTLYRDLATDSIAHLTGPIAAGFRSQDPQAFGAEVLAEHERSNALVGELLDSDVIVIGAPMYNFSVPTQLKAWVDRVTQPGRTFRYTETGPIGLAQGKRAILVSTRGGLYSEPTPHPMDFQEAYLRAVLGFMGIREVRTVRAELLSRGPELRRQALEAARGEALSVARWALAA
ncbi:NAD(P)H dehydrogenase (quinone) [Paracidovorax avenae ATCC 19860]|uniref:FMN dependent NADH:quinone oxidoreductase n=1 Tax=Paracidovorax avenae (strain ATCC 19860 / DSM 7227 / CCUG 15838 / JCM 20985 / LMG 2117 / NCPPB 1011) TaxID=643561 RepID=F0Q5X0_PARA1|nr:FMN-dependent NADH-azoreductase [Paracidovorax avenae]ADX48051.1 NAD(P)H dehydrogenase (quinone) [Paracidovorax avenae ATCC 19860]AVS65837.1 FMN-dependent NADH-azoreductase [Paracidovorax avenae]